MKEKNLRSFTESQLEDNKKILHESFNLRYTRYLLENLIKPISDIWFRAKWVGFDDFPERNQPDRPLILATNHSGMAFPWDAIIFSYGLFKQHNFGPDSARALVSPALINYPFMNPFLIGKLWSRVGGIEATMMNFETMMQQNEHNVLIYPEGIDGIGKGFDKRYKIQELKSSFLRMSIKHRTDIISFSTVNAEYINPFAYSSHRLNRFVRRFGLPFLPIGITTLAVFLQPWFFYIALPARLTYVMGRRIKPYEMIDKPYEEISVADLRQVARQVKAMMQQDLDNAVKEHGRKPYDFKSLFREAYKNHGKLPFLMLASWPFLFLEHERLYVLDKHKKNQRFRFRFFRFSPILIRNPFLIAFFIPIVGWIIIAWKSYRDFKKSKKKK